MQLAVLLYKEAVPLLEYAQKNVLESLFNKVADLKTIARPTF